MNIDRAISHFEYKLKNSWKPTKADIEAYNAIIEYKEKQEDINLEQNENLAKLWVHTLMTLSSTNTYNAEQCINEIDKILKPSVSDWCEILREQLPMMRFNAVGNHKYPLVDPYNITKLRERNEKIINEFETDLTEAIKFKAKIGDVSRFVSNHVTRII
jgi:flagellin-specific chaperone FliS